jgi:hypothetical protein
MVLYVDSSPTESTVLYTGLRRSAGNNASPETWAWNLFWASATTASSPNQPSRPMTRDLSNVSRWPGTVNDYCTPYGLYMNNLSIISKKILPHHYGNPFETAKHKNGIKLFSSSSWTTCILGLWRLVHELLSKKWFFYFSLGWRLFLLPMIL